MIERTKTLLPMQTVIGVINLPIKGQTRTFQILYGGALNPWFEGQMLIAPDNLYENQLRNFFENEGREYIIPSRTEIAQVCAEVKNNYLAGLYNNVDEKEYENRSSVSFKTETAIPKNEQSSIEEIPEKEDINENELIDADFPAKENDDVASEKEQVISATSSNVDEETLESEKDEDGTSEEETQEQNFQEKDLKEKEAVESVPTQEEISSSKELENEETATELEDDFEQDDAFIQEDNNYEKTPKLSIEDFMILNNVSENSKTAAESSLNTQNQIKELKLIVAKQIETINNLNEVIAKQNEAIGTINENFEKFKKKNKGFSNSGQKRLYIAILVSMIVTVGMMILSQLYLPKMESAIKLQNNTDAEVHIVVHNADGTDTFERIGSIVVGNGKISIEK